jgi:hypothetical protein
LVISGNGGMRQRRDRVGLAEGRSLFQQPASGGWKGGQEWPLDEWRGVSDIHNRVSIRVIFATSGTCSFLESEMNYAERELAIDAGSDLAVERGVRARLGA